MAIYPDKKDGKLTGRYRVEVQAAGKRVRGRFDTLPQAQAAETGWKASLARGEAPQGLVQRQTDRTRGATLAGLMEASRGSLWRGTDTEEQAYGRLKIALDIIGPNLRTEALDTAALDALVKKLEAAGKAPATINRYLSCVSGLVTWARQRGLFKADLHIPWRDEDEGRIRWITPTEETLLLALLPPAVSMLVKAAIKTGLRRGELLGLAERDIEPGWVRLWKTKNGAARSVPIDLETQQNLVWLCRTGMPKVHSIRHYWDKAKAAMGLAGDDEFVFHACRHTCATRLVQSNVNLRIIQRWLGHKRIETTIRYAQVNDTMLTAALGQLQGTVEIAPTLPLPVPPPKEDPLPAALLDACADAA